MDVNAQKIIATSVEDNQLIHIMNCTTAKGMWDNLHHAYEQKSETAVHMLQQRWFQASKDLADNMATHIAKIEDLACKLRTLGKTISDSMIMVKILMTLPICYSHFITAWESTNIEQRKLRNLIERLLAEEIRVKGKKQTENEALAAVKRKKKGLLQRQARMKTWNVSLLQKERPLEKRVS